MPNLSCLPGIMTRDGDSFTNETENRMLRSAVRPNALVWPGLWLGFFLSTVLAGASASAAGTAGPMITMDAEDTGVVDTVGGEEGVGVDPASWSDYLNTLFDPVFDPGVKSNVSAVEGQTAHLVCRVNNLGTKTVSWIRHRDTHILTVGSFTYTSDQRFSALHREGTNEWTLQIRHPTIRDSGLYECQVSTKPVRAYLIRLAVGVPTARILHAPELYTDEGGTLNLTCVVSPSPAPPEYIFWYHKGEVVNYETDGSVEVTVRQEEGRTVSTLLVARATLSHSGNYQCAPSNTDRAAIRVHVFKAKEPAAMQTSSSTLLQHRPSPCLLLPAAVLLRYLASFCDPVT
ncbi:zwei Ig domain protein zig-8-like [Penaeus monodon]|uniref:zwei Ig domain protein zig-8-like n=1 Tax=Penaeus monodon TaxID=6687 RepID=UPI0018A7AB7D|nr:zwei Ig domain protein zig-8-like [Penaeus monodon]